MIWETRLSKYSDISRDENTLIDIRNNKIYAVSNFVVQMILNRCLYMISIIPIVFKYFCFCIYFE